MCRFFLKLSFIFLLAIFIMPVMSDTAEGKYPDRGITIICPYGVGGPTDSYVRVVAKELETIIGQNVKVLNIVGGQSVPAFNKFQGEPADGYTIMAISAGEIINTILGRYDYRKITPVAICQRDQGLFWVPQKSKFTSFKDVIEDAKTNPNKQKWTGGVQFTEVLVSLVCQKAGIDIEYAPYKSSNEAMSALAGGFYDVGYKEISGVIGLWRAKKIRPVVVLTEKRLQKFPEIPTAREFGVDMTLGRWRGLGVKKGTSPEIVDYIVSSVEKALQSKAYKDYAEKTYTNLRPGFAPSVEAKKIMDEEHEVYKKIMTKLGMVK